MNILFLTCWYPTPNNNGAGVFVKEHARAIKVAGNNIVVCALCVEHSSKFFHKELIIYNDENNISTYQLIISSKFYKFIYILPHLLYFYFKTIIRSLPKDFKPEVIHSNVLSPCAIIGDWFSSKLKLPHLITEHWSGVDKFMKKNIFSFYGARAYNNAKYITVVSEYLKNNISKHVTDVNKIIVVPNVINDLFRYKEKLSTNQIVFTCIANWKPPKDLKLIINALNETSKLRKNIVLNIIGNGVQVEELKHKNTETDFKINFGGNIDKNRIVELLNQSNYFIHASHTETFSVVIAEALFTGTPVIASNVAAIPELIDQTNGVLANNNVEDFATGINNLLNTKYDNLSISQNAINRFKIENIGNKFSELYQNLV